MARPSSEIQVQSVGDSVKFNCSARGSPLPKVKWFKDGRRVVSKAKHDEKDIITSEFVIHHFKPGDAGMYTCLFYNDKNWTTEANTSLSTQIILFAMHAYRHKSLFANQMSLRERLRRSLLGLRADTRYINIQKKHSI